jgi:8-oxo-dGTP pyrophosphatase MutT (NUDIX family)
VKIDIGWQTFLDTNGLTSPFLKSITSLYYNSVYNPGRKPFDFYTAIIISSLCKNTIPKQSRRKLHLDSVYGAVLLGQPRSIPMKTIDQYIEQADKLPDSDKKRNIQAEKNTLETLTWTSITVKTCTFALDSLTKKLSVADCHRTKDDDKQWLNVDELTWFQKKFNNVVHTSHTFVYKNKRIPIYYKSEEYASRWNMIEANEVFTDWIKATLANFTINCIVIQSVDMFGPTKIGFIKFHADIFDDEGEQPPSIVFMRGGSVGILVILIYNGTRYTVLTEQARVPTGRNLIEIPAGMLDGAKNFGGVAAKELSEEIGLNINAKDLINLSETVYGKEHKGVYTSPGGCDEFMALYYYEQEVNESMLESFKGRILGETSEGEKIKSVVIPLKDLIKTAPDMKSLSTLMLYLQHLNPYLIESEDQDTFGLGIMRIIRDLAHSWNNYKTNAKENEGHLRDWSRMAKRMDPEIVRKITSARNISGLHPTEMQNLKEWTQWPPVINI